MSDRFTYICTKTTADFIIPASATDIVDLARKVHNFSTGLIGGVLRVGVLRDMPVQIALDNHLLCDGSTIARGNFPELVEFLNPGEDTATLPDYTGAVVNSPITVTQTVDNSGTVSTGDTVTSGDVGGSSGGNVPSGGRVREGLSGESFF